MSTFVVETWVMKPGKLGEYAALVQKYESYRKEHPELFKELVSRRGFIHVFGGNVGGCVELLEFKSLDEAQVCNNRLMATPEFVMNIVQPSMDLFVPATYSISIWNSFP
jgi:hypothetical protein